MKTIATLSVSLIDCTIRTVGGVSLGGGDEQAEAVVGSGEIRVSEFRTIQAQAVLFTPGLNFRTNRFLGYFLGDHGDVFDGEPISFDPPDGVPMGTPRAMVRSQDGLLSLQGSKDRLELNRYLDDDSQIDVKNHLTLAARLFGGYLSFLSAGPGHVGCIVVRMRPDKDPARTISRHFCREEWIKEPINRPAEFEVNAMKTYSLGGLLPVNSWVRCSSGHLAVKTGGKVASDRVMFVEQEVTTHGPEIDRDQAMSFFQLAPEELENILGLYFPSSEGVRS